MGNMLHLGTADQPTYAANSGIPIAAFIIAIVGVCLGVAALVLSIVNAVRIGRMKKKYESSGAAGVPYQDGLANEATVRQMAADDAKGFALDPKDPCAGKCSCCKKYAQIKAIVGEEIQ